MKARTSRFNLLTPRSFMCPHIIRGWFTAVPWGHGRDGTNIPEFGMADRTSRSDSASESVLTEDLDGAGITGALIGVGATRCITAEGITHEAALFTTGAATTGEEASGAAQGTYSAALTVSAV